jgi:hypothetical protein
MLTVLLAAPATLLGLEQELSIRRADQTELP